MDMFYLYENIECDNINKFYVLFACEIGNKDIIEWILAYDYKIKIDLDNNLPFQIACENNKIEIAKYIYSKTKNATINNKYIIYHAFNNEYYELIKWLYTINPYIFNFLKDYELYQYLLDVIYLNIDMAEWLLNTFPNIPLYMENNFLFINCCSNNNLQEARLLQKIKPNCFYINILDDEIVHYEILDILTIKNKVYNIHIENCYICYDEVSDIYTSCNHYYCKKCIETHYIRNNNKCPYCRKENNENDLRLIVQNNGLDINYKIEYL